MAEIAVFSPTLADFDTLYGADIDQLPVSLDAVFFGVSGGESASIVCRCACDIGGRWVPLPAQSGTGWTQRPLAEDGETVSYLE